MKKNIIAMLLAGGVAAADLGGRALGAPLARPSTSLVNLGTKLRIPGPLDGSARPMV